MKLRTLISDVKSLRVAADVESEVQYLTTDSREVKPGSLFICMKGDHADGHDLAAEAMENGAVAVITQRPLGIPGEILVEDTKMAAAIVCSQFYGHPEREMALVGVTGTNGKTTVTTLIRHILEESGRKAGLIGTVRYDTGLGVRDAAYTTPDPVTLYQLLGECRSAGCEAVVIECSSQAAHQRRLEGLRFRKMLFLNLSQDHLDYHGTMEAYYRAKRSLFSACDEALICVDDRAGQRLSGEISPPVVTLSAGGNPADYMAENANFFPASVRFSFLRAGGEQMALRLGMPGMFSLQNAVMAAGCCKRLGLSPEEIRRGMDSFPGVRGRMETLYSGAFRVICDYAHTPQGLKSVLAVYRRMAKGRLVTLFGCGGDRDRLKRPMMGRAAADGSDLTVVTSDNPRSEDPHRIIEDILTGMVGHATPYVVIPDRYEAIKWALDHSEKDDIILLAGKGHETVQKLRDRVISFDEREIVARILREKGIE